MGAAVQRRATYEDLLALPDTRLGEIIDGQLYSQPRPASLHALATSGLVAELRGPFQRGKGGPGGWVILFEPELHLHADVVVPDVAGWRRERMPELPDTAAFDLAPDWVCETLSPSDPAHDRVKKMPVYAREKVGHLWLLDPRPTTLEAFRLEAGRWAVVGTWEGDARVRVEPFEAVELELGALWAR
jgi:Uma2 family endonuclease